MCTICGSTEEHATALGCVQTLTQQRDTLRLALDEVGLFLGDVVQWFDDGGELIHAGALMAFDPDVTFNDALHDARRTAQKALAEVQP